mgnify:CR=1 FL=1|tara:strand:- start:5607 stop:5807 length:201 start_codon:yes stop_codon:yes gene_type:complete
MNFCFCSSIRIGPGMKLNPWKTAASRSLGPCGAKYTVRPRGNRTRRLVLAAWDRIEARREFMKSGM